MAVRMPRLRCVGRTAIQLTAAAGRSRPPGMVSSNEKSRPVPTISSPSNAASVRSSSRLVQSSSQGAGLHALAKGDEVGAREPGQLVGSDRSKYEVGRHASCLVDLVTSRPRFLPCPWRAPRRFVARRPGCRNRAEPGSEAALDRLPGAFHATATTRDCFASGAHAGDVRQSRETEADGEHEQADAEVLVDGQIATGINAPATHGSGTASRTGRSCALELRRARRAGAGCRRRRVPRQRRRR